jgi:hypothetical protein
LKKFTDHSFSPQTITVCVFRVKSLNAHILGRFARDFCAICQSGLNTTYLTYPFDGIVAFNRSLYIFPYYTPRGDRRHYYYFTVSRRAEFQRRFQTSQTPRMRVSHTEHTSASQ